MGRTSVRPRASRRSWLLWQGVASGLAIAGLLALLVVPTYRRASTTSAGDVQTELLTLTQAQGWSVAPLLLVPVLLTLAPLLVPATMRRRASLTCTGLLTIGVLVALASIGLFFVPALLAAVVAVALLGRDR